MEKPTSGTEIKHDGLRTLLLDSLDLSERNLDDLEGLSLHPDSFVFLLPDGLFVRPVPQAPPPHHSYIQVCDHFFIPASNSEQMRVGYSFPRSSNLQYTDAMLANFLSRTQGTWIPAAGHTWKNRAGKAAKLDHVVTWNISTSTPPATRWTDSPGQGVLECDGMKYDHAQLLISLDRSILPTPPPAHLTNRSPQPERFDHVLFPSLVDKWRRIVDNLITSEPRDGASNAGVAVFDRHHRDCQSMLGAALALQSRARASLRRARERPEERSKEQLQTRKDIHLYTCALKETVEPQRESVVYWYSI
jgi:hypothetical protein